MVSEAKIECAIRGIEVEGGVSLTHPLFVDEILLFSQGSLKKDKKFKDLLDSYCRAIGVKINFKPSLLFNGQGSDLRRQISDFFPLPSGSIDQGVK